MKTRDLILLSPELYLIGATLYYWFLTATLLNPIAIVLLAILGFQLIYKKGTTGLIIASLFIVLNLYMVLALISELSEFTSANEQWTKLLLFGTLFLGINLVAGGFMFWKYLKRKMS
jgi:hypothetical protein